MALKDLDRLRLYLRDRDTTKLFFRDDELIELLKEGSVEGAAALGWLLKAASAADAPTTVTVGQVSETRGQATETFNICMAMHRYWDRKAIIVSGQGVARWLEIQPKDGLIGDLIDTIEAVNTLQDAGDISRLI